MEKIGFRIRSSVSAQVLVYVYVYLSSTVRQEMKTGLLVKRDSWNSELQRGTDYSIATAELNEKLDRLEQFLLRELNRNSSSWTKVDKNWLENHFNTCFTALV